jgi:hypothetical protein
MKLLRDTVILCLSELLLFYFLLEYEYSLTGSRLGFIMLILSILGGPIYLFCTNNGIAEINFNDENHSQYFKFKEVFFKITLEEKSYLKYIPYLYLIILIIMTIYRF